MRKLLLFGLTVFAGLAAYSLLVAEQKQRPAWRDRDEPPEPRGDSDERRCAAVTASGERCRRSPEPGSDYCWQHGG
ncbi:MAG: hypothetical protein R3234_10685 [Thermoanaerobaculia bacterium]|nr:hypothetical protein [Thermoanaerobaculia bacterium]